MATLLFKNAGLQGILRFTEQATHFRQTFEDAVKAYEQETGKKYDFNSTKLDEKYYETTTPTIFFVKDSGIYLMTAAKGIQFPVEDNSHVCYATGYEPTAEGSWEKCREAVGGDDFGVSFPLTNGMIGAIRDGADIVIYATKTHFRMDFRIPKRKPAKHEQQK